jgi:anti-anti-sigma factor
MEITSQQSGAVLDLRINGRLDAYWANHLSSKLDEVIREGAHRIRVDMADVAYLSSAGIGALVQVYRKLKEIHGSFSVINPSKPVRTVLALAKLDTLLIADARPASAALPRLAPVKRVERESATFEVFESAAGATLKCDVIGDPALLDSAGYRAEHCRKMRFHDSAFALGLGALGHDFTDCRNRFGEFLAVAGAAAYLPTDGTNVPDYLVAAETFMPDVQTLYCLAGEGSFASLARFEANKDAGAITLTELAEACLDIAEVDTMGVVMVAESAGLTGAALRRSPALDKSAAARNTSPFEHPQIRDWLSFTAERAHAHRLALAVGVFARNENNALGSMLRPLGKEPGLYGHCHAAVFTYRPLKKGELDLKATVTTLFESESLLDVLHLLGDDRQIGAGESEFVRGACWIGPLKEPESTRKQ